MEQAVLLLFENQIPLIVAVVVDVVLSQYVAGHSHQIFRLIGT